MAFGALVAYRNLLWDAALTPDGLWEAGAPQENLQTPQLGEIARLSEFNSAVSLDYVLAEPSQIGIIGLLAYGDGVDEVGYRLYDAMDTLIASQTATPVSYPAQGYFPRHAWIILTTPVENVARVEIIVGMDSPALFEAGGVWAGPAWRFNAMPGDWALQVTENRVATESDGNQTRADPQRRYRILTFRMQLLTEREALGVEVTSSDNVSLENSLMDLYFHSGLSLPIVVMPRISDPARIHALGVYGYMQPPLVIAPNSAPDDPASGAYASSRDIVVRESL